MPAQPAWFHRLDEILSDLRSMTSPHLDRAAVEKLFRVTPFLLFSKGRKHYLTVTFNDGADLVGAIEFKMHKSNYRGVLRTAEQVTGLTMLYDQEGVKDTEQTVAERGSGTAQRSQGSVSLALSHQLSGTQKGKST